MQVISCFRSDRHVQEQPEALLEVRSNGQKRSDASVASLTFGSDRSIIDFNAVKRADGKVRNHGCARGTRPRVAKG